MFWGGGRFQETFTALMWKIRPGCKNSNQTTVDSLGVIRAKEEPAAESSTASQSSSHTGSLLARADRQKTRPDPFDSNSGFWALRTAETRDGRKTVWYLQRIKSEGTEKGSTQRLAEVRTGEIAGARMFWGLCPSPGDVKWKSPSVSLNIHVLWAADHS